MDICAGAKTLKTKFRSRHEGKKEKMLVNRKFLAMCNKCGYTYCSTVYVCVCVCLCCGIMCIPMHVAMCTCVCT